LNSNSQNLCPRRLDPIDENSRLNRLFFEIIEDLDSELFKKVANNIRDKNYLEGFFLKGFDLVSNKK